ncbi:MAG: cell division protein FtsZ [Minisyncoccus archaeiphilus]|uniref:cell division protein FtsZ n=1 Tax=Minisyncoccus archaeiphilus TaxID=3238481 RepID=UPI0009D36388|nr:MAG: Cell division protein FtsZ [Parcubacteria group bacterium ADurb.Bin216]GMX59693.1 MAG: cell division protein FtsZ [Candidatus Parcubacteria bacterium]
MTKIKVIGVGGAGCNTISRLVQSNIKNADLISVNTDVQDLNRKEAHLKVKIGEKLTSGLGSGMKPEIGNQAAKESQKELEDIIKNSDIVFLAAGLGGGTGSGAMPVISEIAKKLGILTIGVVTLPFSFEGKKRKKIALNSLEEIKKNIDTLVVIQNDKLSTIVSPKATIEQAFEKCDDLLKEAVESISNIISNTGILNLDFADIKETLKNGGVAFFGTGKAEGKDRAIKAIEKAFSLSISGFALEKTNSILFNVASGSESATVFEIKKIAEEIRKKVSPSAKIIFGASKDESLGKDEIRITIIATSPNH